MQLVQTSTFVDAATFKGGINLHMTHAVNTCYIHSVYYNHKNTRVLVCVLVCLTLVKNTSYHITYLTPE